MIKFLPKVFTHNSYTLGIKKFLKTKFKQKTSALSNIQIIYDLDVSLPTFIGSIFNIRPNNSLENKNCYYGCDEILLKIRWNNLHDLKKDVPLPIHIISTYTNVSHPPNQLYTHFDWTSYTFLNTSIAYEFFARLGISSLKRSILLKSIATLSLINKNPNIQFILLGNDFKLDSFIFITLYLLANKYLNADQLLEFIYPYLAGINLNEIKEELCKLSDFSIKHILILNPNPHQFSFIQTHPFSNFIFYFQNYLEVGLYFIKYNLLDYNELWPLIRIFHNNYNFSLKDILTTLEKFEYIFKDDKKFVSKLEEVASKIKTLHSLDISSVSLTKETTYPMIINTTKNPHLIEDELKDTVKLKDLYTQWIKNLFTS